MTEFKRSDYMDGRCSHREYYAQFVSPELVKRVVAYVGADVLRLVPKDPHLNDTSLHVWDAAIAPFSRSLAPAFRAADDIVSAAGLVCVAKEAARQFIEKHPRSEEA